MADDMEMYGPELITLLDDDGNEHEFEVASVLEDGDTRYVALVASYEDPDELIEDDGELLILKAVEENGEEFLDSIEDEEEFNRISSIFVERLKDEFDFIDGEDS